jgi:small subunit ribosomal protein S4
MKYTGPKVRLSRRLGVAITPKAARVMDKRPYPPGQHGPGKQFRRGRQSAFERQLFEKQKLKAQYNIHEKQLRNYYQKAVRKQGNSVDNLIQLLESRLDAFVLRAGFATTIYAARQYVSHGHFWVNGKPVNIASYSLSEGDKVSVRPKSKNLDIFKDGPAGYAPEFIGVNKASQEAQYLRYPRRAEVPVICEVAQVIEYYSR